MHAFTSHPWNAKAAKPNSLQAKGGKHRGTTFETPETRIPPSLGCTHSKTNDVIANTPYNCVPISDLVGKNILLYFSAHWCPPCRAFLPKLVETYHQIKAKDDAFELIFISSDRDQTSFEEYFSEMPWLAFPFGDERKEYLDRIFKVQGIPMLVAIGPTGRTVSTEARERVMYHGANAYPFTEARLKEIEAENEEMAKGWPKKVKHELELIRRQEYMCDGCEEEGIVWFFYCEEWEFDLHPKCALEENKATKVEKEDDMEETKSKEGWVCDGDVCHKV
ncbi:hypothetical protein RHMOL_Rhmol12G0137400 [Rhododendron molle]|uniref:Uncharacterized protein n=1 Tax=Rhododendron molle TaxID=49168 RepID=A0ACC0LI81_RHOML|nr:hypothetical protein RHMOL_Rhmol12G0137400 [Rhododendron molle]